MVKSRTNTLKTGTAKTSICKNYLLIPILVVGFSSDYKLKYHIELQFNQVKPRYLIL